MSASKTSLISAHSSEDDGADDMDVEPSDEPIIKVFINGVHNLKALLYVWKNISSAFVFEFFHQKILARASNRSNTIFIEMEIPEDRLLKYENRMDEYIDVPEDEDVEARLRRKVTAAVEANVFESHLRSCKKNSHAVVSIWTNDNRVYFQRVDCSDPVSGRGTVIPIHQVNTEKKYGVSTYEEKPLIKMLVNEFFDAIKQAEQAGSSTIRFTPYQNGVQICGYGSAGNEITYNLYGSDDSVFDHPDVDKMKKLASGMKRFKISASPVAPSGGSSAGSSSGGNAQPSKIKIRRRSTATTEGPFSISVPMSEIKSLGRLNSVSPESSLISVYYSPGKPIMFKGNVGQFGIYRIYIRNAKSES